MDSDSCNGDEAALINNVTPPKAFHPVCEYDEERSACAGIEPAGFFIRHPPKPHLLHSFITSDSQLFQTIHMGAAMVHEDKWRLVVDGLVENSFMLNLNTLQKLPRKSIVAFHECFGSPIKPNTHALWRVGNIHWTGVTLKRILQLARPHADTKFVWSEGLDSGIFAGVTAHRYQKDLPMAKAMSDEVLLAYEINGQPLSKERGGPVRLVVPGWFGTNSTKWISKISLQPCRASGPYTTRFYNEPNPTGAEGETRPVWRVGVNSMITYPQPGASVEGSSLEVQGWAWHELPVQQVELSIDDCRTWQKTSLEDRVDMSWQRFRLKLPLPLGTYTVWAKATSKDGEEQPLSGCRNHCHSVLFHAT